MTARWGKGYIQMVWWINKQECSISNVFLYGITPFWHGIFWGLIFGLGFLGFCWKPLGFFWVLTFGSIRASPSLEILSTPPWDLTFQIHKSQAKEIKSSPKQEGIPVTVKPTDWIEGVEVSYTAGHHGTMQTILILYNTCDVKRDYS